MTDVNEPCPLEGTEHIQHCSVPVNLRAGCAYKDVCKAMYDDKLNSQNNAPADGRSLAF